MKRLVALALGILLAGPAGAFDINEMTPEEREAFGAAVREYLLENPQVIFEAVDIYEQQEAARQASNDSALIMAHAEEIFFDGRSWVGGNPEGDITLVEFLDYKCTYCKKAHEDVLKLVETDGNIRFIVKEFPILGEESLLGSRFAIAVREVAGDEAYEEVFDTLMRMRGSISMASLSRIADQRGFDMDVIEAKMSSEEVVAELRANYALAQTLSMTGTPGFVIQTEMMRGYAPLETMRAIVERVRGG